MPYKGSSGGLSGTEYVRAAPKEKPKPALRPQTKTPIAGPDGLQPPSGKPVAALQKYGFTGSIHDFNHRVAEVTRAHQKRFGYAPSPGLVFDVARSPIHDADLSHLFTLPRSKRDSVVAGLKGSFDAITELGEEPRKPGFVERALEAGFGHTAVEVAKFVYKGNKQVAESLKDSPRGVYTVLNDASKDIHDYYFEGDVSFSRSNTILKAQAQAVGRDVRHPLENPGFLALDILGFASAGGGAAARAGAAGKAGSVGEAARTLATKPKPGRLKVGKPGAQEEVLLSENAAVRAVQRVVLGRRQKKFERALDGDQPVPAGALSVLGPQFARDFLRRNFSFENKIGREARARQRVEENVRLLPKRELERVTGWAHAQSGLMAKLPAKARHGLTTGEQKAIFSLALDDANPLGAQRVFHERLIEQGVGDPAAHRAQLAALNAAAKALKNPSPRLQQALALTREAVAEMERIKIDELGLSPLTAESRVAKLGQVVRGESMAGGPKKSPDAFYVPTKSVAKSKKAPKFPFPGARRGQFGIPAPRNLPELTHEFRGDAIRAGDIRVDTTNLVAEAYGATVRKAAIKNDFDRLSAYATKKPRSEFDVPIRDGAAIPERLRAIMADVETGEFVSSEFKPADARAIMDALYPGVKDEATGRWRPKPGESLEGVKWVDSRLIHDYDKVPVVPGPLTKAFETVNEPFRFATLFLRPAYALNIVSNTAALWFQQGFVRSGSNFAWALKQGLKGDKRTHAIDSLVSGSRSRSYVDATLKSKATAGGRALAEFWNVAADMYFRRAAFRHEAKRLGYKSNAELDNLLFKDAHRKDLVEATRRSNKAMIEFDNLTWYEKNYLRHVIFVYPFISRGTVWSVRTILEHPVKTDVLAHLGDTDEDDPVLAQMPEWMKRRGYVPVGWTDDGKPRVVDASSVNTFMLLSEMLHTADAQFAEDRFASASEMFGPSAEFAVHWATGKDDQGNDYPGGDFFGAAQEQILGLPQASAYARGGKQGEPLPPVDRSDRRTLVKREHAALKNPALSPGWLDGYGMLLAGGMTPRTVNTLSTQARFWRDQPLEKRHAHEMDLVKRGLNLQAKFLGTRLPGDVRDAVAFAGRLDLSMKQFTEENARTPTPKERAVLLLDQLELEKRAKPAEIAAARKSLKQNRTESEWRSYRATLLEKFANAEALQDWDSDVRLVRSFEKPALVKKLHVLKESGLVPSAVVHADQESLFEYGRQYLRYAKKLRELRSANRDLLDKEGRQVAYAEMRVFEAEHDKPVTVNGHQLPSLVRMAWAYLTPNSRREALAESAGRFSWGGISPLMKELLGRKQPKNVARGWMEFARLKDEYRQSLPPGGRSFPSENDVELAKYVNRYYADGFYKDWLFSKEPLAHRLQMLTVIQKSPNRESWDALLNIAAPAGAAMRRDDIDKTATRDSWHDYVEQSLIPWVEGNPKFKKELSDYGPSVLYKLIDG
jgi:hypothetical protein